MWRHLCSSSELFLKIVFLSSANCVERDPDILTSENMVKVEIEYCEGCGYAPQYEELARQIASALPTVEVIGRDGRTAAFEIEIDGELIFSKRERGAFPNFTEVIEVIRSVEVDGGDIRQVQGTQASDQSCSIC